MAFQFREKEHYRGKPFKTVRGRGIYGDSTKADKMFEELQHPNISKKKTEKITLKDIRKKAGNPSAENYAEKFNYYAHKLAPKKENLGNRNFKKNI